jgi:ketosteroid isomerase-like protein
MINRIISYISLFLLLTIISCTGNNKNKPDKILNELLEADNESNLEKVISLYTNDAMLIPAGKPNIIGIDSIKKNYKSIFANYKLELLAETYENEIVESGSHAIIYGITFGKRISLKDQTVSPVNDKFIMILKKINRKWKVHRLMWSNID